MHIEMNEQLPDGWVEVELRELGKYVNGRAFKPSEWRESGLPIIRIQNLNNSTAKYNYTDQEHESKYLVRNGDLLMAWSGSLDAFLWQGDRAWLNQHIFRVEPNENLVSKDFLFYSLKRAISDFYTKTHGSGLVHITKPVFEAHKILLPPLAEQARIVTALDGLMARVRSAQEQLATVPKLLKRFRQSVLSAAVSGQLTEDWRAENPDVESAEELILKIKAHRYEAAKTAAQTKSVNEYFDLREEGGSFDIPEQWSFVSLGKICYSFNYGTSQKSDSSIGKVPVLRMGNLQNGNIDWSDLKYTSDDNEIKKYELKTGDVLFNRTNSPELVGKTSIYKGEKPAIFAGYLIRINTTPQLDSAYLNYVLNSDYAKEWCLTVKSDGISQSNINAQKLSAFELPFCSIDEQQEIVRQVSGLLKWADKSENNYRLTERQLDAMPAGILAKAFAGELTEQDPTDEPAQVLLKRILAEREEHSTKHRPTREIVKKNVKKQNMKELSLLIFENFGYESFTFDELRNHVVIPYQELKDNLFQLIEKSLVEDSTEFLSMDFDEEVGLIKYNLRSNANKSTEYI